MISLRLQKEHHMDVLSSVLLFATYAFLLLTLILFSAGVYQKTVESAAYNRELSTTLSYLSTKIHQHDQTDHIFLTELEGKSALCLRDMIGESTYITYIYEQDGQLKELFTKEGNLPSLSMGSAISEIKDFHAEWKSDSLLSISFSDDSDTLKNILISLKTTQKGGVS